ncbi:G-protein coupled receptor 171 [Pithys albifrons albifrons]|uniref:G-protein coupled receptor 171 n=1 Tax=Pithys albifrons albifrons TaxID=3385563 RepID=UPI003A5D1329
MSSNISECHVYEEMEPFTYFYYLIFLVGIIGSCFALWAFTQKDQKQKSMSIYLINLLTADFLLTLTLPVKIIVDLGIASWNLRIFHCQVTACFIYLNMYLSIVFLGFVSMDRCLQLMHSSKIYRIQEPGFAKTLSAVVWAMLLLITVPNMAIPIKHIEERPGAGCIDFKTKFGRDWHVFTNFICTAIFLNFSAVILISNCLVVRQLCRHKYSESYGRVRKALTHTLLVTAGYLLCFVPYHAVRIPYTLSQSDTITSCPLKRALFKAKESTLLFAVSNLCFDPILYYHLSKSFRLKFAEAFAAPKDTQALPAIELQLSSEQQTHSPDSETQGQREPSGSTEPRWAAAQENTTVHNAPDKS